METEKKAALDTIVIEPVQRRFMLVWRASQALKRNMFEMRKAVVGRMAPGPDRVRKSGKVHYASLEDLAQAPRRERAAELLPVGYFHVAGRV